MAVYRNVHISFWQDEDMIELTPEQKYFYLYLMTNSRTNQVGCYKISKRVMEFETGYNKDTLCKLLQYFVDTEKIGYSEETQEIIIFNWLKYNWSNSPKVISCIEHNIKDIVNIEFTGWLINYIHEQYNHDFDTLSIQYPYSGGKNKNNHKNKQKEKTEEETEEKEQSVKPDYPPYTITLSKLILNKSGIPKITKQQIDKGADTIYKLERLDGYKPDEIQQAIEWGLADDFWKGNLLSGASLRKKKDGVTTKFMRIHKQWKAEKDEAEAKRKEQEKLDEEAKRWL